MGNAVLSLTALAAVLALLPGTPAEALNSKSFVSGTGSNVNNCASVASACATFAHAVAMTAPGGEITVVNAGDYGPVAIGQSINITNDGAGEAGIVAAAVNMAVIVNASVGDVVSLRGLVMDGQGVGEIGLLITSASAVHVQNCVIRNFEAANVAAFGIFSQTAAASQLFVSDTIVFNNGTNGLTGGIGIVPTTGSANVVLDRVHLENNVIGLYVSGANPTGNGVHVAIRDSVVSGNAGDGIQAFSQPGRAPAFIVVEHTSVLNNGGNGLMANGPHATMLLNDDTVARNGVGISAINSGQLISYGNNKVNNNIGPDGVPSGSYSPI